MDNEQEQVAPQAQDTGQAQAQEAASILGGAKQEQAQAPAQDTPAPETTYDFRAAVPEGMEYDEQAANEFGALAQKCNLTREQAQEIAAYGMNYMRGGVEAARQAQIELRNQWGEDAKRQLGGDFEKVVARAGVGMDKVSQTVPGLRAMLDETGAGNRIEMIRLMAAVGDLVGEDTGHAGAGYGGEKSLYPNTNFNLYK